MWKRCSISTEIVLFKTISVLCQMSVVLIIVYYECNRPVILFRFRKWNNSLSGRRRSSEDLAWLKLDQIHRTSIISDIIKHIPSWTYLFTKKFINKKQGSTITVTKNTLQIVFHPKHDVWFKKGKTNYVKVGRSFKKFANCLRIAWLSSISIRMN